MDDSPTTPMKIEVTLYGRFAEVHFTDFEDDTRVAASGLLTREERVVLTERLRDVAAKLESF